MGDGKRSRWQQPELGQNFRACFGIDYLSASGIVNWSGPPVGGSRPALSAASSWLMVTTRTSRAAPFGPVQSMS